MLVQTERRFKIFVVPARDQSFVSFCFQLIGQGGGSFSTARNCATVHPTTTRQSKALNLATFMSQSLLLQHSY
jgi:hypothetical protein